MPARVLLLCLPLVSACTTADAEPVADAAPVAEPPANAPQPEPPAMPAIEPTDVDTLDGVVHELQSVGHYTYVRVGKPGNAGDWAVVMGALDTSPGAAITLSVQGSQTDFHSRRLDRDFDRLFFASAPTRS